MPFDLDRIGAGLPVAASLPELSHALGNQTASRTTVVIQAPPGTGKTTLIPPALHNHTKGKILVTAPRRVAVRAAARRLRHLDPQRARLVGFAVRGEYQRGDAVEFVTPGVLLRRLLTDPGLEGISGVIIDEVHERQLDTDLALGMLRVTTLPAPMTLRAPMLTPGSTVTPAPNHASSPMCMGAACSQASRRR